MNEAELMRHIQVKVSTLGGRVFRNNIGRVLGESGHYIQYGLANPGGSDLIGWVSRKITDDMVGSVIAQFTAIEVKSKVGRLSKHQLAFIEAVQQAGGTAVCARSVTEVERIMGAASDKGFIRED